VRFVERRSKIEKNARVEIRFETRNFTLPFLGSVKVMGSQERERGLGVYEVDEQKGVKTSVRVSVKHGLFYKAA
jgi:hypothetical protein